MVLEKRVSKSPGVAFHVEIKMAGVTITPAIFIFYLYPSV
jgi:hypothetical protein